MEIFIDLLKQINIVQLLAIFIGFWFFYNRLDKKIESLDKKIDNVEKKLSDKIDSIEKKLSDKIDKLDTKVEDIDRRLCRIEGSLSTHGHCLFNQSKPEQKAQ